MQLYEGSLSLKLGIHLLQNLSGEDNLHPAPLELSLSLLLKAHLLVLVLSLSDEVPSVDQEVLKLQAVPLLALFPPLCIDDLVLLESRLYPLLELHFLPVLHLFYIFLDIVLRRELAPDLLNDFYRK